MGMPSIEIVSDSVSIQSMSRYERTVERVGFTEHVPFSPLNSFVPETGRAPAGYDRSGMGFCPSKIYISTSEGTSNTIYSATTYPTTLLFPIGYGLPHHTWRRGLGDP